MEPTEPGQPGASLVALRCDRCSGSFDFRALEPIAVCPYCQHQQALPEGLVAHVAGYATSVDSEKARAQFHLLVAQRYAAMQPTAWVGLALWGVTVIATLGALAFAFLGPSGGLTVGGVLAAIALLAVSPRCETDRALAMGLR